MNFSQVIIPDGRIPPATTLGAACLAVASLDRAIGFYNDILGLTLFSRSDQQASLSTGYFPANLFNWEAGLDEEAASVIPVLVPENTLPVGSHIPLLHLVEQPNGRRVSGVTGLYHLAIRLPTRLDLAQALERIIGRYMLLDATDHGVSESLYLADPDGNGIALTCDRPQAQWPVARDGVLRMRADPLDLDGLLAVTAFQSEKRKGHNGFNPDPPGLPDGSVIGHIHLHVSNLRLTREFYADLLGFKITQRYGPGALFVGAGGYHHHLGFDTWQGEGAPAPPPDALGLRWFSICLPDRASLESLVGRIRAAGLHCEEWADGFFLRDPSKNGILLTN
jgi:catechol 2,3-dioxygenase